MKRRTIPPLAAILACVLALLSGSAFAFYTVGGGGSAEASVTALLEPTITSATAGVGGTVELKWSAVEAPNGSTVSYYVTRGNGAPAESCPEANGPKSVTSCTDTGLNPGTYQYKVTAVWSSWSKTSAVKSATVSIGAPVKFNMTGSTTSPGTGAGPYLTITAVDSANKTVTNFAGSHNLVFSGAATSAGGQVPTVANAAGTAIPFGESTTLTFTGGIATGSSLKNGYVQIYKPGEAKITAAEGSLTTPTPLSLNVLPTAAKFVLTAAATTVAAGSPDTLTIEAFDKYGNPSTNYTGSHNLTFSGASTSPGGTAPTVVNSAGTPVAFGAATAIVFNAGVATVSEGKNGEMVLYASGAPAIKVAEGSTVTMATGLTVTVTPLATVGLGLVTSSTNFPVTTAANFTVTAKDVYGNTTPSYTGPKNLTFSASGTASETSPGGNVPGVYNSGGTLVPFGTTTAITFTNGTVTGASNKNGTYRLFKPGASSLAVSDGTFTSAAVAPTATIGAAKRFAISSISVSAGTVSTSCFFSCTVTGLGNSGTITAAYTITDEYGNAISNIGTGKTVNVASTGTAGSTVSGSPLSVAESGTATTSKFIYTAPSANAFTNAIAATQTGYTTTTITASR